MRPVRTSNLFPRLVVILFAMTATLLLPGSLSPGAASASHASLSISPASGLPGTKVTLTGARWTASPMNPSYRIFWEKPGGTLLGSFAPDPNGNWSQTIAIPGDAKVGTYQIHACEGWGGEFTDCSSRNLAVTAPAPAPTATRSPTATPTPTPAISPGLPPTRAPVATASPLSPPPGLAGPTAPSLPGPTLVPSPSPVGSAAECGTTGAAGEVVITFDGPEFPPGAPIDRSRVFAGGVRFLGQHVPTVIDPAVPTRSEPRALYHDFGTSEFGSAAAPLRIGFTDVKDFVAVHVGLNQRLLANQQFTATLTAFGLTAGGGLGPIARDSRRLGPDPTPVTICLAVSAPSRIMEVTVDYGESTYEPEIIDDLIVRGSGAVLPVDQQAPRVTISSPTEGVRVTDASGVALRGTVVEGRELVSLQYSANGGPLTSLDFYPIEPGRYGFGLTPFSPREGLREGDNTIQVVARDARGNVGTAEGHFVWGPPRGVDLWILGMEYNQLWHDQVYTDWRRGAAIGMVPISDPTGRDTEWGYPMIQGKPMLVRVYVGLRDTPAPPAGGASVTGRLKVYRGFVGEREVSLPPLETSACTDHLGTAYPCQSIIQVFPSLGTRDLDVSMPYDLDLISQRASWSETLNFVIPPEVTSGAWAGLILEAEVWPADFDAAREVSPLDNRFELQIGSVADANPLDLRLVRVALPGFPAPTTDQVDVAFADLLRMTPFDRVNVVSDDVFFYDRATLTISGPTGLVEVELDECETLWVRLFWLFGLDRDNTLLALTPSGDRLDDCGGMGWKVPDLGASGSRYRGGIALSRMPEYAGDAAEDRRRVAVLAQEVYHAALDRRHISLDHAENEGCFLESGAARALEVFAEVLEALSLGITRIGDVDFDCWKPTTHPHGGIGTYPATTIEVGRPGDVLSFLEGRMFGRLGGMGVKIEPDGASWRLTLYDPCPTGPLDRTDPLSTLSLRVDLMTGRYACMVSDDQVPHDFLSYGTNRWFGLQLIPNIKTFFSD